MNTDSIAREFVDLLKSEAKALGLELKEDLSGVQSYASARIAHLSRNASATDFAEIARTEANNILLQAATAAVDTADRLDMRLKAFAQGALALVSKAIAVAV